MTFNITVFFLFCFWCEKTLMSVPIHQLHFFSSHTCDISNSFFFFLFCNGEHDWHAVTDSAAGGVACPSKTSFTLSQPFHSLTLKGKKEYFDPEVTEKENKTGFPGGLRLHHQLT